MKGIKLLLIIAFFVSQPAAYAQVKTIFGDEVGTLDGIIKAYYDVVTVKKGELPSFTRDSMLHVPNPQVGSVQIDKSGKPVLKCITLKEFHRLSDAGLAKDGFFEKEISRKVEHFGSIYHVWSTYESRLAEGTEVIERGINSIELFFDGTRFWITSWIFDSERKNNPIPKEYLTN